MADGVACIGLLGDSGLFITAESATLVVAVIGRCGIAIEMGAECSCDTPLGGEILLKGIVEFSVEDKCPFSKPWETGAGSTSMGSSRSTLLVLLVTEKVALLEKRVAVGLEAEPLAEPVRAATLGAADGGD